jgi:hypothetical protein
VRSEDVPAVRTSSLSGAVGVKHKLPAATVNADVVVERADEYAVRYRCLAAVGFVAQVVHVAVDRWPAAVRPGAFPVTQQDGTPDVGRDRLRETDVQGKAGGVPGFLQQSVTEDGRDAGRP